MSDTDKDIEIFTLRHQLAVLQRQTSKPRLTRADRTILAALLHRLPRAKLRRLHLIVGPDTILRWLKDVITRPQAADRPCDCGSGAEAGPGENSSWGVRADPWGAEESRVRDQRCDDTSDPEAGRSGACASARR